MNDSTAPMERPNPAVEWYREWSTRTPLVTRTTLQVLAGLYLLSWVSSVSMALVNIPFYTVLKLELYRLVLAPLFCNSLLNLIFTFIAFSGLGNRLEVSMSTVRFLVLMATMGIVSNLAFAAFCCAIAAFGTYEALFFTSQGFWGILFGLIAIECCDPLAEPTRQLFMLPYAIPTKYYPLALFALFSLLGGPDLGHAMGLGMGYLYASGYGEWLKPSLASLQRWERGPLACLMPHNGFVSLGVSQGSGAWSAEVPTARAIPGGSGGGGWSSSSSSSRSSQGGGRGGGDVESGNGSSSSSYAYKPVPSAPPANEESFFPGGGRTLAASSSSSSSSSGSGAGGDGGWMRGSSGGGGDSVAAVRAARLAALEGRSSSAASSSHEAPSSLPVATAVLSDALPLPSPARKRPPISTNDHTDQDGSSKNNDSIAALTEMGYGRTEAEQALAAANGDVNAAAAQLLG